MDSLNHNSYSTEDLISVFGDQSKGYNPEDRAATSDVEFVRSQVQVTFANERAKGRRLLACEALAAFGWDILLQVAREGSASIVQNISEPAKTLSDRRRDLRISEEHLARHAGVPADIVRKSEIPGELSTIRDLEKISQSLSLDERVLGFVKGSGSDRALGVRLRQLHDENDSQKFTPSTVVSLSEAAWVISRQHDLSRSLNKFSNIHNIPDFVPDNNYSHPAWKQGFRLAAKTRELLDIEPHVPITRLRYLIETKLDIPLVQQKLNPSFAGATLANGNYRGIVVNEEGANSNVWIRRMTLCHELGHLLWDPDQHLNKLKVDVYKELNNFNYRKIKDSVEVRANAFAVAFLAPPEAVTKIVRTTRNVTHAVVTLMTEYGISMSAAKRHISNITQNDTEYLSPWNLPSPSDDWNGRENFTVDWFPSRETPLSRRGKFSWIVALSLQRRKISEDTASMMLKIPVKDVREKCNQILDAYEGE